MLSYQLDIAINEAFGFDKTPVAISMSQNFIILLSMELQSRQRYLSTTQYDDLWFYCYRGLPIIPSSELLEISLKYKNSNGSNSTISNKRNRKVMLG